MLANAVKFTERGEVVVTATVERLADGGGSSGRQRFHLTIRDTGIGIDPESMKKLFQCFRQGHESMTRKYGGTGGSCMLPYQPVQYQSKTQLLRSRRTEITQHVNALVGPEQVPSLAHVSAVLSRPPLV